MSGGVDSSVAAALLKRAGFDVIGGFMELWKPSREGSKSERKARKVAHYLNIPFYQFNFQKEFKKRIVDYFLKEYQKGRTPNPCVVCNNKIKFGLLLEKTSELDIGFLASGHYVRIRKAKNDSEKHTILKARDEKKDQSYFLWQLTQPRLKDLLFPVGDYQKSEVRDLADDFNLPLESPDESHEVCFIPNETKEFLQEQIPEKPGKIMTPEGKELGNHQGVHLFTLGQRKGLGLANGPWYVLDKDVEERKLVVTKDRDELHQKSLRAGKVNWITGQPDLPLKVKAKIRYNSAGSKAELHKEEGNLKVVFAESQWAIAPGQSVVFYEGDRLLGGGIIQ